MSEKRWTQNEVDAIVKEVANLEGLHDVQVAEGKANIERKYGLSAGMLSRSNPSTGAETEKTFEAIPHWPYFRPATRPKEKIPDVFVISEALRPRKKDSSSGVTSEQKKPEGKSARQLYTENFRDEEKKKAFK
jgi:hypothetical protein